MKHACSRSSSSSCHLVNANKTPDRGVQAPREFEREARYSRQRPARADRIWVQSAIVFFQPEYGYVQLVKKYKKAVLSQRWPRNAPYRPTWVPWKFSGIPDYAHVYYSQHFSWAFVRIDSMNVPTKFEVRSFTRSWDNRGYPKKFGHSPDTPTLPFLTNFQ